MVRYIGGEAIEVIDAEASVNDTSGGRSSLSSSSCMQSASFLVAVA